MKFTIAPGLKKIIRLFSLITVFAVLLVSCRKNNDITAPPVNAENNEAEVVSAARMQENNALLNAQKLAEAEGFSEDADAQQRGRNRNIVQIVVSTNAFSALEAAVLKTGLAGALSNPSVNLTVFAPTNNAFSQLPAPFNNATNISNINNAAQIDFLRQVLLYHVLGTEVFSNQVANGRSSAETLKGTVTSSANTIYFSKTFGLIRVNGQSTVFFPNINANNGVIHAVDKVLLFPTENIAQIATGNPAFSALVQALVKTDLVGLFTGNTGDFSVFAPTDAAFAQLPAPFNNAANISNITDPAQIAALSNILRYHVTTSRYFAWDLGILSRITTAADAPNNKVTTVLGYNQGWVRGDGNNSFSRINPADILATNGVVHVIDRVLLPQ